MDSNSNGLMRPESTGSEKFPLISVGPPLHRKKRAQDLSLLSLQSDGSHDFVAPVGAGDDATVSVGTTFQPMFSLKYTLFQSGYRFSILLFPCKLALLVVLVSLLIG